MDVQSAHGYPLRSLIRADVKVPGSTVGKSVDIGRSTLLCDCKRGYKEVHCEKESQLICVPCYYANHIRCKARPIKQLFEGIMGSHEMEGLIKELGLVKAAVIRCLGDKKLHTVYRGQERKGLVDRTKRLNIKQGHIKLEREVGTKVTKLQNVIHDDNFYRRQKCRNVVREIDAHLQNFATFEEEDNSSGIYIEIHKVRENMERFMDVLNEVPEVRVEEPLENGVVGIVGDYYTRDNLGSVKLSRSPNKGTSLSNINVSSPRSSHWASIDHLKKNGYQSPIRSSIKSSYYGSSHPKTRSTVALSSNLSLPKSSHEPILPQDTKLPIVKFALQNFNIKHNDDLFENQVSSIKLLNDERFLILDCRNNKVKLFSKFRKCLWALDMCCAIWDMTFTNESQVLVTCPSDGWLQYVQISKEHVLFKTGHIVTTRDCRAICTVSDMLYVSYSGADPCIRILSMNGVMFRTIPAMYGDTRIMQNPLYMLVQEEGRLIYISDFTLQKVSVIDHRGTLLYTHHFRPGWPLGMTTDRHGNVLVCVSGIRNIKRILKDNSGTDTIAKSYVFHDDPCTIAINRTINLLYIAFHNKHELRMLYIM